MAHDATATHDHGKAQYFWVWGALLAITGIEIVLAYKQVFDPLHMLIVLLVLSVIKAALIIAYFMHLKFEIVRMKVTLMAALVVCLTLMFVFFADAFRILQLGAR
ncbi:MAG TPA: cytochrome C oxidase subunit IV family protein [Terriglobales bacterium]|nr:cytochrome C oxidase subunit IV family protein [Terriglobales bacterium]